MALIPGGGAAQPQINAINLLRVAAMGMEPGAALAAPRWIVDGTGPDGPDLFLFLERRVPAEVRTRLASTGLDVVVGDDLDPDAGHAHLIVLHDDDRMTAAADPRSDGSAEAG